VKGFAFEIAVWIAVELAVVVVAASAGLQPGLAVVVGIVVASVALRFLRLRRGSRSRSPTE